MANAAINRHIYTHIHTKHNQHIHWHRLLLQHSGTKKIVEAEMN